MKAGTLPSSMNMFGGLTSPCKKVLGSLLIVSCERRSREGFAGREGRWDAGRAKHGRGSGPGRQMGGVRREAVGTLERPGLKMFPDQMLGLSRLATLETLLRTHADCGVIVT